MIENVLTCLDAVRKTSGGYISKCPAHNDKHPSLSIRQAEDRVLLYCHAGCTVEDVCSAIGLSVGDLFIDEKKLKPGKRKELEVRYNTWDKFENMRHNAFLAMADFRSHTQLLLDELGVDIDDELLPAVNRLPEIEYHMGILASGTKAEILELAKEGVISKWLKLWNLQKKKQSSSVKLILSST